MAVAYTKDSAYAQEARKWEATHTEYGAPGRPLVFQEYPKRLYKALTMQGAFESIEVTDENEERNYQSRGFRAGQDHAIEALEAQQTEVAMVAANRAYHERSMSESARAEAQAYDNATLTTSRPFPRPRSGASRARNRRRPLMAFDPLMPEPQEYPKTIYVPVEPASVKAAPPVKVDEPTMAITVHSPEEEARALKGEPLEQADDSKVSEPTTQERQAYEKVVAYERQNLSPSQQARAENGAKAPARKAKAAKPSKAAKKSKR